VHHLNINGQTLFRPFNSLVLVLCPKWTIETDKAVWIICFRAYKANSCA